MEAKCQCGQLSVTAPGPSRGVIVCHCSFCQRRSGSPFGALAYYPSEKLKIAGEATRFERPADAGGVVETFFCPSCGSTLYVRLSKQPTMLGVPVGAFCDPKYPAPMLSAWEDGRYDWVVLPEPVERLPQG